MRVLSEVIDKQILADSENIFEGPMVKGVVDVRQGLLAIDASMHADIEQFLLKGDSCQDDLWGINLWYEDDEDFIEFDSMINVRPRQGNRTRGVEDEKTQERIREIVTKWIR